MCLFSPPLGRMHLGMVLDLSGLLTHHHARGTGVPRCFRCALAKGVQKGTSPQENVGAGHMMLARFAQFYCGRGPGATLENSWGIWVAQVARHLPLAQVMIPWLRLRPASGSLLSGESASPSAPPSLLMLSLACSLFLSNK